MSLCLLIISTILIIYIWFSKNQEPFETIHIVSDIDNLSYKVLKKFNSDVYGGNSAKQAANMMAKLNKFVKDLMTYMEIKYMGSRYKGSREQLLTKRLINKYKGNSIISENLPDDLTMTSYTLNKSSMWFCLRDDKDQRIHDFDTIAFVCIHELAHMVTEAFDHPEQFWVDFKFLLSAAEDSGLYQPIDYSKDKIRYCGLDVKYNPYYDKHLVIDVNDGFIDSY